MSRPTGSLQRYGHDATMTTMPSAPAAAIARMSALRGSGREFLFFAAITAFTGMPAFVMDGVMVGATLNTIVRNGMVASFVIYLGAAIVLQNAIGVAGLWIAINLFFITRAVIFWSATRWKLPQLFSA